MAGSGRTGSRLPATRCSEAELERRRRAAQREPRAAGRRRQGQGEVELPPLQLLPASSATRCRNVTDDVGLQDMSPFAKCDRLRPGRARRGWTPSSPTASRRSAAASRSATCCRRMAACAPSSRSIERAPRAASISSRAGALERHDHDMLRKLLPARRQRRLPAGHHALRRAGLAGPRSRELLQRLTDADLSNAAFPWLTGKPIIGRPCRRGRAARQLRRRARLGAAPPDRDAERASSTSSWRRAQRFGIKPFGIRAMMSMALEKSYRLVGRELSIEYSRLRIRPRPLRASQQGRSSSAATRWWRGARRASPTASSPWRCTA